MLTNVYYLINGRIPEEVREDLEESLLCLSVAAYRGSAVLARRSIQQACLLKKCKAKTTLSEQIDELYDNNHITEEIYCQLNSLAFQHLI